MGLYTNFIKLFKPNKTENYDINVFNENADLIDSALEQLENKYNNHSHGYMKTITLSETEPANVPDGEIIMVYEE